MATVMKKKLTVEVTDIGGHVFTVADTDTNRYGTLAWNTFKAYDIVEIKTSDTETVYVPYHAVDHVKVTVASENVEVEDKNCVTEKDEPAPEPDPEP